MSQTVSLIKRSSLQSRPDFLWLSEELFCFPDPNYHFYARRSSHAALHTKKKSYSSAVFLSGSSWNIPTSLFSHPSIPDKQSREREWVRAHFQTLPLLLYFTLSLNVSPEASDRHASVYELTLNRWGEEIGERGGGERQRAAASCKFMTSFFFPGHYVQHALTSLISFIYWQRQLPERKQRARSPHPPDPYSVTHCLICFIGVDARWAASEGRN